MKKLDLYIIKKYFATFFFTVCIITMIAVVIDFSEKVGKFIDKPVTTKEILFDYYLNFIPWINGLLWPLFSMIAVIFFTSRMAKQSEIIPMLSAGISYNRILVPYIIASSFIAGLLWFGNNYLIPKTTKIKNEFEHKYIKSSTKTMSSDIHCYISPNEKIYLRYFRKRDTSGQIFRIETFKDNRLVSYIKASRIKLKEAPNRWTLFNYEERKFDGMQDSLLVGQASKKDTTINLSADDFIKNTRVMENMTSSSLREYITRENARGLDTANMHILELHRRNADPFTIIILTMIGVAIASRKTRGGIGLHLAIGIIIGSAYVILSRFSSTFVNNLSFSPIMGVWIPNIVFGIIAIILILRAQK